MKQTRAAALVAAVAAVLTAAVLYTARPAKSSDHQTRTTWQPVEYIGQRYGRLRLSVAHQPQQRRLTNGRLRR